MNGVKLFYAGKCVWTIRRFPRWRNTAEIMINGPERFHRIRAGLCLSRVFKRVHNIFRGLMGYKRVCTCLYSVNKRSLKKDDEKILNMM